MSLLLFRTRKYHDSYQFLITCKAIVEYQRSNAPTFSAVLMHEWTHCGSCKISVSLMQAVSFSIFHEGMSNHWEELTCLESGEVWQQEGYLAVDNLSTSVILSNKWNQGKVDDKTVKILTMY